jgi:RNA polymerase sigma factor (sigma-70 family)
MANSGKTRSATGNAPDEVELLEALLRATTRSERDRRWAPFARRYERLLASCVLKVLRRYGATFSREDLDDLINDVWLLLLRDDMKKLRQYDATRGFRIASFLGMVATNATIDYLRARDAESVPLDDALTDLASLRAAEAPAEEVEERQRAALAQAALAQLSGADREFVQWAFRDEVAPEEMARALGISTNTVYSRKFKVRAKLQRIVAQLAA